MTKKKSTKKDELQTLLTSALDYHRGKDFTSAANLYKKILNINKHNFDALNLYGALLLQVKDYSVALDFILKAANLDPSNPICFNNKGICLKNLSRYEEALSSYNYAIALNPKYLEAIFNRANLFGALKKYNEAIRDYDEVINLRSEYIDAIVNKANILGELRRYDEAIKSYELALAINPNYENALLGIAQTQRLTRDYEKSFHNIKCAFARGVSANALSSLGDLQRANRQNDLALVSYSDALKINPDFVGAWYGKGLIFSGLSLHLNSIKCFSKVLELDFADDFSAAISEMILNELKIAIWSNIQEEESIIQLFENKSGKSVMPFLHLALSNNPKWQYEMASKFLSSCLAVEFPEPISIYHHSKIRVAYFSSDYGSHPVSLLLAETFEIHNRELFEIIAFCLKKPASTDLIYEKLTGIFDYFIDVEGKSDKEIAQIARELEIDIAIDLGGHTQDSRPDIFAHRAAPVQVNYFGFAGTTGAKYMDYIIADHIVIPPENQIFFSENIAYLPNSYMVDDSRRLPSDKTFARSDFGLPENKFIFCCFNNGYKFNPQILEAWSKILLNSPNSIIWLTENNAEFASNILREFSELGISPERVIFAKRLESMADHLARYRLVDLFLDTHPYNAHTTALDALKMGVPVITYCGKTFAGRVATSLLTCLDLTELVVDSLEQYVSLATKLSLSSKELEEVKHKLAENLKIKPLFDTRSYVNNLEILYLEMYRRYLSGLSPETFSYGDIKLA